MTDLLDDSSFPSPVFVADANAAERMLAQRRFDFVIVNGPLADGSGISLAMDIGHRRHGLALLLLPAQEYVQNLDKAMAHGVFLLQRPATKASFITAVHWLCAAREQLRHAEKKALSVEEKMGEIRTVNRAKWFLIESKNMTEAQAHRYIEKQAMDRCTTRLAIAREIIENSQHP